MFLNREYGQVLSKINCWCPTMHRYKLAFILLIVMVYWLFLILVQWNILEKSNLARSVQHELTKLPST